MLKWTSLLYIALIAIGSSLVMKAEIKKSPIITYEKNVIVPDEECSAEPGTFCYYQALVIKERKPTFFWYTTKKTYKKLKPETKGYYLIGTNACRCEYEEENADRL